MEKSRKMEGFYHGQRRTTWLLWKEGVKHRQFSAVCGERAFASNTVFSWVQGKPHGRLSLCGIVTSLNIEFVKSSGAPKGWQRYVPLGEGRKMCPAGSYLIFTQRLKGNATNEVNRNNFPTPSKF